MRSLAERIVLQLLAHLPDDEVIAVFLALRKARKNHKHAARAIVRWTVHHPRGESVIARRRASLVDAIEHALGRDVARACMKHVTSRSPEGEAYLARTLHSVAGGDPARTDARLRAPAGGADAPLVEAPIGPLNARMDGAFDVPKTVTATNRGDIWVHAGDETPRSRGISAEHSGGGKLAPSCRARDLHHSVRCATVP